MKPIQILSRLLLYWMTGYASLPAMAQVTAPVPAAKQAADALAAKTRPGYYAQRLVTDVVLNASYCNTRYCAPRSLPVRLVTFTGQRVDASSVDLRWETSEEISNDHFVIQRTLNPANGFETVAVVKGAGSTRSTTRYEIRDLNAFDVYTYYRLKQVDIDGTFEYSSIIAVKGNDAYFTVTAFPNPGHYQDLRFKVTGLKNPESLSIQVYDTQGVVVYQNDNYTLQSQEQAIIVALPDLLPGKYSIKLRSKNREAVTSFMIVP
jgi:hypothetical protein